jgi:hypothetical protein
MIWMLNITVFLLLASLVLSNIVSTLTLRVKSEAVLGAGGLSGT